MATNFSPCKGSYVLNQFPSNVMFAMNGFTYQPVERYRAIMALLFNRYLSKASEETQFMSLAISCHLCCISYGRGMSQEYFFCHSSCSIILARMVTGVRRPSGSYSMAVCFKTSRFVIKSEIGIIRTENVITSFMASHLMPRILENLSLSKIWSDLAASGTDLQLEFQERKLKFAAAIMVWVSW